MYLSVNVLILKKFLIKLFITFFLLFPQDDEDGHLVVLTIIEELMNKRQEEFLDHFARLGVFSKVQSLMGGSSGDSDSDVVIRSQEEPTTSRAVKGKKVLL